MKIISTHKLTFQHEGAEFTTAGGNTVELAPDWVKQDDYFRAGQAAGQLTILEDGIPEAENKGEVPLIDATNFPAEAQAQKLGLAVGEKANPEAENTGAQVIDSVDAAFETEATDAGETTPKRGRKSKADQAVETPVEATLEETPTEQPAEENKPAE